MTKLSSTLAMESKSYSKRAADLHRQVWGMWEWVGGLMRVVRPLEHGSHLACARALMNHSLLLPTTPNAPQALIRKYLPWAVVVGVVLLVLLFRRWLF
jgi:hypothetical protein